MSLILKGNGVIVGVLAALNRYGVQTRSLGKAGVNRQGSKPCHRGSRLWLGSKPSFSIRRARGMGPNHANGVADCSWGPNPASMLAEKWARVQTSPPPFYSETWT